MIRAAQKTRRTTLLFLLSGFLTVVCLHLSSCGGNGNSVTIAPETTATGPKPSIPLLFIPGYAASTPTSGNIASYAFVRGGSPQNLKLSSSYAMFVRSMMNAGYVEGQTFFGAVYDWRMTAAPDDGVLDGTLSSLTAQEMTSGTYQYAVNYLGYWLDQAVQANPNLQYVDVVTHSTGGVLARAYIQSPAYGGAYVDKNGINRHLPKIRFLILGACPNLGTLHSWRPWENDFQDALSGFIPTTEVEGRVAALAYASVIAGQTIQGPDHNISLSDILAADKNGNLTPDPQTFFRLYVPMRQSLMPTNNFLFPANGGALANVNDDPYVRSETLLDINALSTPGNNPWAKTVGIPHGQGRVIAAFSSGAREKKDDREFVIPGLIDAEPFIQTVTSTTQDIPVDSGIYLPLPSLLTAAPATVPDSTSLFTRTPDLEGLGQLPATLSGDGNAPYVSYLADFQNDPSVTLTEFGNGPMPSTLPTGVSWNHVSEYPCYHDVFFYNPDVRKFVVEVLTGKSPVPEPVVTSQELGDLKVFLQGLEGIQ